MNVEPNDDHVQLGHVTKVPRATLAETGIHIRDLLETMRDASGAIPGNLEELDALPVTGWRRISAEVTPRFAIYAAPADNEGREWRMFQISQTEGGTIELKASPISYCPTPVPSSRRAGLTLTWNVAPAAIRNGALEPTPSIELRNTSNQTWKNVSADTATAIAWISNFETVDTPGDRLVYIGHGPVLPDLEPGQAYRMSYVQLTAQLTDLEPKREYEIVCSIIGLDVRTDSVIVRME